MLESMGYSSGSTPLDSEPSGEKGQEILKNTETELKFLAASLPLDFDFSGLKRSDMRQAFFDDIVTFKVTNDSTGSILHIFERYSKGTNMTGLYLTPEQMDKFEGFPDILPDDAVRRIRLDGDTPILTIKTRIPGRDENITNKEFEIELSPTQYDYIKTLPIKDDKWLSKTRYYMPYEAPYDGIGGREMREWLMEIDVYRGELEGLITVEVEANKQHGLEGFALPEGLSSHLIDISREKEFKNNKLIDLSAHQLAALWEKTWEKLFGKYGMRNKLGKEQLQAAA